MSLVIKFHLNDETRRVTLEKIPSYSDIIETARQLFPTLEKFTLKYEDDEKDIITLANDKDVSEALNVVAKTNVLRLTIFRTYSIDLNLILIMQVLTFSASNTPTSSTSTTSQTSSNTVPSSNSSTASPPNPMNMENFPFAPLLSQFIQQQQQQQQQQPQQPANPFAFVNNNNNPGIPPFLQQLLQNPQTLQMIPQLLPTFLPMITNYLQNASPQQKDKIREFLSNPQVAALVPTLLPQLLPFLTQQQQPQQPSVHTSLSLLILISEW